MNPISKQDQLKYKGKKPKNQVLPKKRKEHTVWTMFSKSVRLEAVTIVCGNEGLGPCYTCGKVIKIKDGDAGHCISRRFKSVKYNRLNVKLQCKKCNKWLNGNQTEFIRHLGVETYLDLLEKSKIKTRLSQVVLNEIYDESLEIINRICKEKNIQKW